MTPKRIAIALLVLAFAAPTAADAGLITWELEGTIELVAAYSTFGGVDEPFAEQIVPQLEAVGVTAGIGWRSRITFDSDTPAEPCDECIGYAVFNDATKSIDFLAGGFSAGTRDGTMGDARSDSWDVPPYDQSYDQSALAFYTPMQTDSAVLLADSADLYLLSLDPTALFSTSLPTEPPDLATLLGPTLGEYGQIYGTHFHLLGHGFVWDEGNPFISGGAFVPQSFTIDGRITSIARVPESSVLALLLFASAVIALRRRSRALP